MNINKIYHRVSIQNTKVLHINTFLLTSTLLINASANASRSLLMSLWTCSKARSFSISWVTVERRNVFRRRSAEKDLFAVQDETEVDNPY
jgi:hypothetical protein